MKQLVIDAVELDGMVAEAACGPLGPDPRRITACDLCVSRRKTSTVDPQRVCVRASLSSRRARRAPFAEEELNDVIKLGKKGKAPRPDGIIIELIKWLNQQNRNLLLKTINSWWEAEEAPKEFYYAKVATLCKKGETSKLKRTTSPMYWYSGHCRMQSSASYL